MRSALLCAFSLVLGVTLVSASQRTRTTKTRSSAETNRHGQSFDADAFYKANCAECHGSAAEKRFNPDNPESQMIDAILNGAKAEDTKDMPPFNQKGIDEQKAKTLITYMKSLRE